MGTVLVAYYNATATVLVLPQRAAAIQAILSRDGRVSIMYKSLKHPCSFINSVHPFSLENTFRPIFVAYTVLSLFPTSILLRILIPPYLSQSY